MKTGLHQVSACEPTRAVLLRQIAAYTERLWGLPKSRFTEVG